LRLDDVAYIDEETHGRMAGTLVKPNDLLLNITGGSLGRCCLVPGTFREANVSQHVAIIRVVIDGVQTFLHRLVLSPYFQSLIVGEQTGAGRGGLPKNRMDQLPVALPPLAEQRRIVAKLDALMVLCDRLEASLVSISDTRRRLLEALLAEALAPADQEAA
jgi:type I restriction enzyme S subunit